MAAVIKPLPFVDIKFQPNEEAIIEIRHKGVLYQGTDIRDVVEWRRLKDLQCFIRATDGKVNVRLFEDGVRTADINQGSVGDCWLLSSLACLASRPGAVEKLFLTPEYNEEGRYQLRLWDKQARRYSDIVVDDHIPIWRQGGQPCYARPAGNEAWVLLLEKAMAKHVGSYASLSGGMASWALETLTGHYTCVFLLERKFGPNSFAGPDPRNWKWLRAELATRPADRVMAFGARSSLISRTTMYVYDEDDASKFYAHEEVFMAVVYHLAIGNLVAAATVGTDDEQEVDGVVRAHAYTVVAAQPVSSSGRGQLLMIQVRNPHGKGGLEWSGDWSDRSTLWLKHPEVAAAVGYEPPASVTAAASAATDGYFWMEWRDFVMHFKELTFCCANGFDYVEEETPAGGWVEVFEDSTFPHDHRSLGDYKFVYNGNPMTGAELDDIIKWMRLKDVAAPDQFRRGVRGLKLFSGGGTHPDDIDGSSNGLMVAVACLANKPGGIEELFVSGKEYRPDGAYQVRLYEPTSRTASIAPFDDWIPCFSGNPITKTKILGSEVWVLLLEKAVAHFVESYSKVSMWGVQVCWALACLTGEYTCLLMWEPNRKMFRRLELRYTEKTPAQYRAEYASDEQSLIATDDVFRTFAAQLLLGCLVAAETDREEVDSDTTGLARARNYSVLDARVVTLDGSAPSPTGRNVRLVKLRDPARQNEWKGDWSDSSSLWDQHPAVARTLDFKREAAAEGDAASGSARRDGSFWMTFEDFLRYFRTMTLCGKSLRGNTKPWLVRQDELDAAARRLAEARRLQQLRAEQEALEDAQHRELRRRAADRAHGPDGPASGQIFAQAAIAAAAAAPKRQQPRQQAPAAAAAGGGSSATPIAVVPAMTPAGPTSPRPMTPTMLAAPAAPPAAPAAAAAAPAAGESAPASPPAGATATLNVGPGAATPAAGADPASSKPQVVVVEAGGCKGCAIM
ncbi:hypothetical protein Agub_g10964 [Astrephomene gubernaculifera]|uniref:Calpain catalytic domain-containing protein n=1 Tax=Astrephomene gubernaculifera TaxID=47775 RepID=A0AAD3HQJ1_9CHLO|nr:hypothetical protein Agub_g10964 [Astrephomene gubernaculifera]